MKKYFLFRKEEVNISSVTSSDTGVGLSLLAVPTDKVSYISSELGRVKIVFNDVTVYQEANLRDGESLEKSSVFISCNEGDELDLVESILKFISSEKTVSNVMKFDVVTGDSTLSKAVVEGLDPQIRRRPTNMQSGRISSKIERDAEASSAIAGIDFGVNQPIVDYNHEGLSSFSNTAEITSWANAGSGSTAYNIATNVGTPSCTDPGTAQRGLTTKAASFAEGEHFIVPTLTVDSDYTIYMVFDTQYTASLYTPYLFVAYGDAAGETAGPNGLALREGDPKGATDGTASSILNTFQARHAGQTGAPANTSSSVEFPRHYTSSDTVTDSCHVLIVRRDKNNNMFYHSGFNNGDIIGSIVPQRHETSGRLVIERLGTTKDLAVNHFHKSSIARFGVIENDIGADGAAQLAQDLFNHYNF